MLQMKTSSAESPTAGEGVESEEEHADHHTSEMESGDRAFSESSSISQVESEAIDYDRTGENDLETAHRIITKVAEGTFEWRNKKRVRGGDSATGRRKPLRVESWSAEDAMVTLAIEFRSAGHPIEKPYWLDTEWGRSFAKACFWIKDYFKRKTTPRNVIRRRRRSNQSKDVKKDKVFTPTEWDLVKIIKANLAQAAKIVTAPSGSAETLDYSQHLPSCGELYAIRAVDSNCSMNGSLAGLLGACRASYLADIPLYNPRETIQTVTEAITNGFHATERDVASVYEKLLAEKDKNAAEQAKHVAELKAAEMSTLKADYERRLAEQAREADGAKTAEKEAAIRSATHGRLEEMVQRAVEAKAIDSDAVTHRMEEFCKVEIEETAKSVVDAVARNFESDVDKPLARHQVEITSLQQQVDDLKAQVEELKQKMEGDGVREAKRRRTANDTLSTRSTDSRSGWKDGRRTYAVHMPATSSQAVQAPQSRESSLFSRTNIVASIEDDDPHPSGLSNGNSFADILARRSQGRQG